MASRGGSPGPDLGDHQRILEATLDAIPDVIGVQDLEHRIVRYNAAGYDFFGLTPEQAHGRHCHELMGWPQPCQRCATTMAIHSRSPSQIEKYVEELDRWLEVRAYPVLDDAGEVSLVIEHLRDITDRKLAEQALRESEEKYALVADRANDAIVVLRDEKIAFVNEAWERMTGYSLQELRELPLDAPLAPEERERVTARYRARVSGEDPPAVYETRLQRKDGAEVEVEISAARFDYGGQRADLAVIRDISRRKAAERERRELEARVQQTQKLESLGVLAGGIAHDFNNLLVGVLGNASLALANLPAGSPAREAVEQIESAASRAAELVQQMLAYAGKRAAQEQELDLGQVVQEMSALLESSVDKKAELRLELAAELPVVRVDPDQIRQVVMGLVTNASEALGGETGVVTLATGVLDCDEDPSRRSVLCGELAPGRYCYLRVSDTGRGMDAATRARIFEPFFTTKSEGRGLGLAAVLGIVHHHRGAVQVESEPGRTVFTVLLPALERRPRVPSPAPEQPVRRGRVLLVDDEQLVRSVGQRMLQRLGFEVELAADGREGLALFSASPERFCLVLLDLSMPVMDGTECLTELRRIRPDIPVVLSSGYTADEARARFSELGLDGFMQKPYRLATLAGQVEAVLRRKRD